MSAIACSIRGDVKNILLPPPEARLWFAASSPLSDRSDARVLCLALWFWGFALLHLSSCMFISSDNADRFLKLASTRGCTVSTMVLSATRGLVLFRVIREGIGFNTEAQCHRHCAPTGDKDAHPRTRASQEPTGHHQKRSPEMEGSSPETLKRLAISVCQRRSFLPSSIELA